MQKKIKLQKVLIGVLAFLIAAILFGTYLGRSDRQVILVVAKENLDLNKVLNEQEDYFKEVEISGEDFKNFGGSIVRSKAELANKRLAYNLPVGSPIPTSALTNSEVGGAFATTMPKGHTIFMIPDGVNSLPPGAAKEDLIDVALTIEHTEGQGAANLTTGVLFSNIEIFDIQGTNLYLKVTQQQFLELSLAKDIGKFVLSLPGQKEVMTCDELKTKVENEIKLQLDQLKKDAEKSKNPEEVKIPSYDELLQEKLAKTDCYSEDFKASKTTKDDIVNKILNDSNSEDFGEVIIPNNNEEGNTKDSDNTQKEGNKNTENNSTNENNQ